MPSQVTPKTKMVRKPSKSSGDIRTPVKGKASWTSTGGTVYTKAVIYVTDPDSAGRHFFIYPISKLTVLGEMFVYDLTKAMRSAAMNLGVYSPDVPARVFCKIAEGDYNFNFKLTHLQYLFIHYDL